MIDPRTFNRGAPAQPVTPQATPQAPAIPEQYQNWNPGAQYQITPNQWAEWGGGNA